MSQKYVIFIQITLYPYQRYGPHVSDLSSKNDKIVQKTKKYSRLSNSDSLKNEKNFSQISCLRDIKKTSLAVRLQQSEYQKIFEQKISVYRNGSSYLMQYSDYRVFFDEDMSGIIIIAAIIILHTIAVCTDSNECKTRFIKSMPIVAPKIYLWSFNFINMSQRMLKKSSIPKIPPSIIC